MHTTHYILLIFVGYIIFTIDKKQKNFPVPTILVLLGIGLSLIPYFSSMEVTKDLIYHIFLPPLLFTSAYRFPAKGFKNNAGIISVLASIGIILTVILLGAALFALSSPFVSMSFVGSLMVASILTPTDPVSVTSILKYSTGDEKIADVVEGESLINDGTSIVIFTVLAGMLTEGKSFGLLSFLGEFLLVSLGGVFIGVLFGWLVSKAVHFTHNREYQVMLSIVLAFGVFNLAERFHFSGVLATVFAGIMLSLEFGHTIKEDNLRDKLDGFWNIIELTVLALIFLLIGIQSAQHLVFGAWGFVLIIFALSLIVRFLIIYGTTQLFPHWRKEISWRESIMLTWSGLKGTMSVYLLLNLQSKGSGEVDMILSLGFAAVLISLVVQSLGVYPLSKKLMKPSK
ncbi:cation:proton antiporter [Thalassobacillus pellis]|uniref:cation:proton antiporter n=1 Tax=Thalassobacillus pellis TaxID=748008 RepID=UPI001960BC40|nr:sodium:proton antiporter [Thalassobacillus pellis]MBM7554200.1 CPA1 family monovalent cation:H+ antiporter [Thalassobacillus pellis]